MFDFLFSLMLASQSAAGPPAPVPPPGSCQAALGPLHDGVEESELPNQVDGTAIAGRDALLALRGARRDAPIVVRGGNFAGADFRGQRLHNVCFLDTDLAGSDWRDARAPGVGFVRANLSGARLAGAQLRHVLLRSPDMTGVDAMGADLSNGRLDGGWNGSLQDVRLDRANLAGFRFDCGMTIDDGCPIDRRLSLRGADLTRASLHSWWFEADFADARLDRTEVAFHQLRDLAGGETAGPLIVRGGDATALIGPAEYRSILARLPSAPEDSPRFDRERPAAWLRPGAAALFVEPTAAVDPDSLADPLFARLIPVIVGSASSRVAVAVNADGSLDAAGEAIGGNAHLCSLEGRRLALEVATGWYSGPYAPTGDEPAQWRHRPMPVLRFWDDRAEVYQNGHPDMGGDGDPRFSDYASCGARAGFGPMIRIPVTEAEARAILRSLAENE